MSVLYEYVTLFTVLSCEQKQWLLLIYINIILREQQACFNQISMEVISFCTDHGFQLLVIILPHGQDQSSKWRMLGPVCYYCCIYKRSCKHIHMDRKFIHSLWFMSLNCSWLRQVLKEGSFSVKPLMSRLTKVPTDHNQWGNFSFGFMRKIIFERQI